MPRDTTPVPANVVERNIRALLTHRLEQKAGGGVRDRIADAVTRFTGSITRLITLVAAMAERMGIDAARDPELSELSRDVEPEKVIEKMEAHERKGVDSPS